jgi:hypothetical protein
MSNYQVFELNCETNEVIMREMTKAEIKQQEKDEADFAARQAETEAKAQAKAELLERLGITADEAKLLLA